MTTLADLTRPLTTEECRDLIYQGMIARGVVTTTWKPGAVVRTIIFVVAMLMSAFSSLQAQIARGGFLDLATGTWLTLLARHVYRVDRIEATFATGEVTLDNAEGGLWSGGVGDLIVFSPSAGKSYRNTAPFTINPLQTGVIVPVQAVEAGSASSVGAGEITELETTLTGVTVTNDAALIGVDEEGDEALRVRCRERLGALSPNGPADAYRYFARTAVRLDGSPIGVTRVRTIPDGYGGVDVYVATATGGVTGDQDDPATDLGAVHAAIEKNVVPICVEARTHSASSSPIDITYEAWIPASRGLSEDDARARVLSALMAWMSTRPIGGEVIPPNPDGFIRTDAVHVEIGRALGGVIDLTLSIPAADVALAVSEAPVLGDVDGTIHIVQEVA